MTCNPFTVFLSLVSQTISWFHHSYAKLCYTRSYLTDTLSPFGVWRNMRKAGNPDLRFLPWCLQNWIKIIHSGQWNVPPPLPLSAPPPLHFPRVTSPCYKCQQFGRQQMYEAISRSLLPFFQVMQSMRSAASGFMTSTVSSLFQIK